MRARKSLPRSSPTRLAAKETDVTTSRPSKAPLILALTVAMFATSLGRSEAFLDKTRFVAHLGVAYFCFHHWVMRPYEAGAFTGGAPHRVSSLVKGGAALLFAVHEVKVSEKIARKSNDPLLQKLVASVSGLSTSFASVGQRLKSGQFSPSDAQGLSSLTSALGSSAAAAGAPIKDVPVTLPGT